MSLGCSDRLSVACKPAQDVHANLNGYSIHYDFILIINKMRFWNDGKQFSQVHQGKLFSYQNFSIAAMFKTGRFQILYVFFFFFCYPLGHCHFIRPPIRIISKHV